MQPDTLRLRDGRAWQVFGGGAGPALVWLHGMTGVAADDPFVTALAAHHRVYAPVAPGFGNLDEVSGIDDIHDLALAYDDLLEGLRLGSAALVGHSFGAMVAAEIAAHFPQRASALVLLSPVGLWNDAYPVADVFALPPAEMEALLWNDAGARERFAARRTAATAGRGAAEQMIAMVSSLAAVAKFTWPIPDKGLSKRLPRIAAPTLVVFGAADRFVSARYAEDFRAGLRHGETAVIDGAGHMAPYERTEETVALVTHFVRRAGVARNR